MTKLSLEDVYNLSHRYADRFGIYFITYEDLLSHCDIPYSTLTKLMSKWVRDEYYIKKRYGYEAHFIHPDYYSNYLETKNQINTLIQQYSSTYQYAPAIKKLQLIIAPSNSLISNLIYHKFKYTEYHKNNSNNSVVVIPLHDYHDYKFICYPNKPIIIWVEFRSLKFATLEDFQIIFKQIRNRIIDLCGISITEHFSFIITQIYGIGHTFTDESISKIIENKNIHFTFSEAVSYLSSKYYTLRKY